MRKLYCTDCCRQSVKGGLKMAKHKIRSVKKTMEAIYPVGFEINDDGETPEGATFPSQRYVEDLRNWCEDHQV